jgi:hypothetical protein
LSPAATYGMLYLSKGCINNLYQTTRETIREM